MCEKYYTEVQWIGPSQGETTRGFPDVSAARAEIWKMSSRQRSVSRQRQQHLQSPVQEEGCQIQKNESMHCG